MTTDKPIPTIPPDAYWKDESERTKDDEIEIAWYEHDTHFQSGTGLAYLIEAYNCK